MVHVLQTGGFCGPGREALVGRAYSIRLAPPRPTRAGPV